MVAQCIAIHYAGCQTKPEALFPHPAKPPCAKAAKPISIENVPRDAAEKHTGMLHGVVPVTFATPSPYQTVINATGRVDFRGRSKVPAGKIWPHDTNPG